MKTTFLGIDFQIHTIERKMIDDPLTLICRKCKVRYDAQVLNTTRCPRCKRSMPYAKMWTTKYV